MATENKSGIPMFDLYEMEHLCTELGLTESYLSSIRNADQPPRPKFKHNCSAILGNTIQELFGIPEEVKS